MRKETCLLVFLLLIMSGYLIVLADPWPPFDSESASRTLGDGVSLNVYVSYNYVRVANPNFNFRSYHWCRASNLAAAGDSVGHEYRNSAIISHGPHSHSTTPATTWENSLELWSTLQQGTGVSPYTAIWHGANRNGDTVCEIQTEPYNLPAW